MEVFAGTTNSDVSLVHSINGPHLLVYYHSLILLNTFHWSIIDYWDAMLFGNKNAIDV